MKYCLLIFLFFTICSCQKTNQITASLIFESEPSNFPTQDKLDVNYKSFQVLNDTLIVFDKFNHEIIFFDLISQSISSKSQDLNGPNGFDSPINFTFLDNSNYVLADDYSIAVFDKNGIKTKEFNLFDESLYIDRDKLYGNPAYLGYRNNLISGINGESIFLYFQKKGKEKNKNNFAELNLYNGKIEAISIDYPSNYEEIEFTGRLFQLTSAQSDKGIYFLFSGSPEISFFDFNTKKTISKSIISFEGKSIADPPISFDANDSEYYEYIRSNPFYTQIIYDDLHKLIYRISSPSIGNSQALDNNIFNKREIILTVLDENLNELGNLNLGTNRYDGTFAFSYSKGIWLALHRELQNDENYIKGDLIKIEGIHY
ncbi:DUF4221 domain-containing protein [Belliella sp. DSM 107340]|uniref:DUF4221 domain-containing protein n=1 Tax=Belliella calami TaxID=2923436 RepID=A0ABS9USQ3_9BACT|nr:DUF4221 domain-containing protein [Belliella calami]MCH7399538.1 DUF4221 domain-containing protein [Belliella calami]